jgi:hypothetical protein
LAALFPLRRSVTPEQFEGASRAWAAFSSPDPMTLATIAASDSTPALPYLSAALRRHLEQFPSHRDGLNRTERQALQAVADGPCTLLEAFLANQQKEDPLFMGDSTFALCVRGLAGCREPLLRVAEDGEGMKRTLHLTDAGRRVLSGGADHMGLNGIDRWLGGVHVCSPESVWRWDGWGVTR